MSNSIQTQRSYLTVGVTGHIDHGKTTLVGVLTGIDTDTHPEEKRRGITIDLGFASLTVGDHTFAFIDAPGHQKYIGNLLAGVSAVDVGLLVVACDQGIQEQTLEHAGVLKTLGVPKLIVALSRIDMSDTARRMELTEELEVFLADFGFDEIPIIPCSSVTGEGIEDLKRELCRAADDAPEQPSWLVESSFRMPIDRVLNVPGRGLVVAGTIWSGTVTIGDMLQLSDQQEPMRVREIEVHGEVVSQSRCGVRTAINLAGSCDGPISRGDELVAPNSHLRSKRLVVELTVYADASEIRCPATVHMHAGTTSCSARITGVKRLEPGSTTIVVIETELPVVATFGQACLFRRPYPVGSIGGGRFLAALDEKVINNKGLIELGNHLTASDPVHRLVAWVEYLGECEVTPDWCELQLGVPRSQMDELVDAARSSERIAWIDGRLISTDRIQRTSDYIVKLLTTQAQASDDAWIVRDSILQRVRHLASPQVIQHALRELVAKNTLVTLNGMVAIASEKTQLSKKQRAKMEEMLKIFAGERTPPTTKALASQLSISLDAVNSLLRHAAQQRILTELGQGFFIATAVFTTLCQELQSLFDQQPELAVPTIKDEWNVTRKHAIPLLEYCDRHSITVRKQDLRIAGPGLSQMLESLQISAQSTSNTEPNQ